MTPHTRMMELSRSLSRPVYEPGACNSTRFWQWQSRRVYGRRTQARAVIPPPYEHAAAGCRPARARTQRLPRRGACARPGARRTRAPRPGRWPTRTRPGACPGGQSPRPGTPRPPPPACARRPGGPRAGAPSLLIAQGATQCAHDAEITTTTTLTERNKELSFSFYSKGEGGVKRLTAVHAPSRVSSAPLATRQVGIQGGRGWPCSSAWRVSALQLPPPAPATACMFPRPSSAACCCSCHGPGPHRGPLHGGRRDAGPDQQPPHVVGGVAVVVAGAPARAAACHGEAFGLAPGHGACVTSRGAGCDSLSAAWTADTLRGAI